MRAIGRSWKGSSGRSETLPGYRPAALFAPFALYASDPKFWDKGLSMIAGFIDELEAMEG
jgi:hypothetical protein